MTPALRFRVQRSLADFAARHAVRIEIRRQLQRDYYEDLKRGIRPKRRYQMERERRVLT